MKFGLILFLFYSYILHAEDVIETESEDIAIYCKVVTVENESEEEVANDIKLDCKNHSTSGSSANKVSPFSVVLQTGGYAGLASAGINFKFLKRNEVTLLGGYVPLKIDGQQLWQLNFKYELHPFNDIKIKLKNGENIAFNPFHFGAGVIYGIHKNLFVNLPPQYPENYYNPTALRYTFQLGTSVKYKRVTLYVEYTALDVGAISYFFDRNGQFFRDNYKAFGLAGIGTLGFGAKINLNGGKRK